MAKKVIRMSESQLKNIVKESVSSILNEIGYRTAALAHGANYNAKMDKKKNNNPNAIGKANKSNNIKLPVLTQAINGTFPNLILPFMEDGAGEFYSVVLHFKELAYYDSERFVLKGRLVISGTKSKEGCVEYNFSTGSFYRVIIMANGAIRRTKEIEIDPDGKQNFENLLTFMTNYSYSRDDYENNVNLKGATPSKVRK